MSTRKHVGDMTTAEFNDAVMAEKTEAEYQAWIVRLARANGWLVYHTYNSMKSDKGWPDVVLCKPPRLCIWEVKSAKGKPTPEQEVWVKALKECGEDAQVVYPCDWRAVEATLSGEAPG